MFNNVGGPAGRGIDLAARYVDVCKLVASKCHFPTLDPEELLQEVCCAILRKNKSEKSAWDSSRASFSKYVVLVARSTGLHMLDARRFQSLASSEAARDVADERDPILLYEEARELGLNAVEFETWLES